jgi:membrane associated rhomboid family serine protease
MTDSNDLPVWAREDAFALAGPGEWGWVDRKGRRFGCGSFHELEEAIVKDAGARADLVWTPGSTYLVLPEEIPELLPALREAKLRWAEWEIGEGKRQMLLFGVASLILLAWNGLQGQLLTVGTGLALLLFFFLGLMPWYRGRKRARNARLWAAGEMAADAPVFRFETWLDHQKTPFTRFLFGLIALVGIAQLLHPHHALSPADHHPSITAAGLIKTGGHAENWWRLFTAPFLHGNPLHFMMNASALLYLGRRVESFARWPHMLFVFLFSALLGGEASARFVPAASVGASGGLMGLLGFLIVFETMHPALVPESARKRLFAGVIFTAVLGFSLFRYIDNAAHAGGLVAGMIYSVVVFPRSASVHRPRSTPVDFALGSAAAAILAASALFACWKMFS